MFGTGNIPHDLILVPQESTHPEKLRSSKKFRIRREIRDAVHYAFVNLKELQHTEWDYTIGFREPQNESVNNRICQTVHRSHPDTTYDVIMEACKVYFNTRKYKARQIMSNTHMLSQKRQRKRQRQTTLRMRRLATLKRMGHEIPPSDREKLEEALTGTSYISSEESEEYISDMETQEKSKRLIVRRLGWRSDYLNYWFSMLDSENVNKESRALTRVISTEVSQRTIPYNSPSWAVAFEY